MVFGVSKETRWKVRFGKNRTQNLVEIEFDPPKTGSIFPQIQKTIWQFDTVILDYF